MPDNLTPMPKFERVEFLPKDKRGVLDRLDALSQDIGAFRDRLARLQSRMEGLSEPAAYGDNGPPIGGLKGNLDRIENDMRSISRTLSTLEELF